MTKLPSPMTVAFPAPLARCTVEYSKNVLPSPICTSVSSPRYLVSIGAPPIATPGANRFLCPTATLPSKWQNGPTSQLVRSLTRGPTMAEAWMIEPVWSEGSGIPRRSNEETRSAFAS